MIDESIQETVNQITNIASISDKHILEIGCGDGRITKLLSQQSNNVFAIEPDADKVALVQNSISNANIQVGSGEDLQFQDDKFDLVIFTLSLHHHQNRSQALNEAHRVVKIDGKIIIIEPVADGELEIIFSFVNDEEEALAETQNIINESGLSISDDSIFTANWIFDDASEVCSVLKSYYPNEFSKITETQIYDFLGSRKDNKPIVLFDKLRTQVIQKI